MAENASQLLPLWNTSRIPPLTERQRLTFNTWFGLSMGITLAGSGLLILLLVSAVRRENSRSGSRILLLHLMSTQLLLCGLLFPIHFITSYLALIRRNPTISCSSFAFIHTSTTFAQNWSQALIAVNRFVAIGLPHHYRSWVSRRTLAAMIVAPWVTGFAITLPVYFGIGGDFTMNKAYGSCFAKVNGPYLTVWFALGNYVPLALTGVLYISLFVKLAGRKRVISVHAVPAVGNDEKGPRLTQTQRRHIAIARMLVVSVVCNGICLVPAPVITSFFPNVFARNGMVQLWLVKTMVMCGYAASPVIFLIMSSDYQKEVRRVLCGLYNSIMRPEIGNLRSSAVIYSLPLRAPVFVNESIPRAVPLTVFRVAESN
ncbi:hypothetical protein BV898_10462 [Hypsibius exemplaris]|uniref:G-protein coupled receptors family 1 profile domain-containing protein n=1 Tax=Hypsibius exemplaris TaxID=2072580 RepID=A0A1W0WJI1_HYPEX|nr:hypothetical protein BV898_10462 [Hypsibius exemplaris]